MSKSLPMASLPLRDLLQQLEKTVRELHDHLALDTNSAMEEFHELTRPKRKRSGYPTLHHLSNGYEKWAFAVRYSDRLLGPVDEGLQALDARVESID